MAIVAMAGAFVAAAPQPAPFPAFTAHVVDRWGDRIGQTSLADVDRDGDLDWIAGNASHAPDAPGAISWWEFVSADRWVRHDLGRGNTDVGAAVLDVNGDGWIDVVAGSVLLLNSGRPKEQPFAAFDIGTIHAHDMEVADVDGDGRPDIIANSDRAGLFWYSIPADPRTRWPAHEIASLSAQKIHGGVSPKAVADLDGDGVPDVVTARTWYRNLGRGLEWRAHSDFDLGEAERYGVAVRTWTGDLDGDGDIDVVQAEADHPDGRIAWFENDGRARWRRHLIRDKGQGQDWHSLAVADFDGDGDLDIYAGAGPLSAPGRLGVYVWENAGGARRWTERTIATGIRCHEAEAADVDGDGDIDIVTKPWSGGNEHVFLENRRLDPSRRPR